MTFQPTPEQQLIFDVLLAGDIKSIGIEANPGSAKTTTMVEAIKRLPGKPKGYMTCFGADIKKELEEKLKDTNFKAKTFNSFGWLGMKLFLKDELGRDPTFDEMKGDNTKYRRLAETAIAGDFYNDYNIPRLDIPTTIKYDAMRFMDNLVRFAMVTVTEPHDLEGLVRVMTAYEFEPKIDPDLLPANMYADDVKDQIIDYGLDNLATFMELGVDKIKQDISMTFTEQIYYTVKWKLKTFPRKYLFIDEAQDMSKLDLLLLKMCVQRNGTVVIVGDSNQGIMRFKGSMPGSFETMLSAFNATRYKLSATFRCPRRVVRLANMVSPDLQAFFNKDGVIDLKSPTELVDIVQKSETQDIAIIARKSAPLITMCLALITADIPCTILGTDIGEELNQILDKLTKIEGYSFSKILDVLKRHRDTKVLQMTDDLADERDIQDVTTTLDALKVLIERNKEARNLEDLKWSITSLFKESHSGKGIKLMTAHKSKGMEFDTVILVNDFRIGKVPDENRVTAMPIDEAYVWFVAITRTQNRLIVLNDTCPDWLRGHLPGQAGYELPPFVAPSEAPIEPEEELPTEPEAEEPKLADADEQQADKPARTLTHAGEIAKAWAVELLKEDFYILDVETTDLNGEIVQLAVCDKRGNVLINTLIKPVKHEISEYTKTNIGITPEMVKDAPTFAEVYHTLVDIVRDKIVIAYNSDFDSKMVRNSALVNGLPPMNHLAKWNCAMKRYCVYNPDKVNKGYSGSWWKLEEAIEQENIDIGEGQFHDAKTDIRATLAVIQSMAGAEITAFDGTNEPLPFTPLQWGRFKQGDKISIIPGKRTGTVKYHLPPEQYSIQVDATDTGRSRVTTYQDDQLQPIQYDAPLEPEPFSEYKDQPEDTKAEDCLKEPELAVGDRVYVKSAKQNATIFAVSPRMISVKLDSGSYMAYPPKDLSPSTSETPTQPTLLDAPPKLDSAPKTQPIVLPKKRKPRVSSKVRTQVKKILNAPNVELDHLYEIQALIEDAIKDAKAKAVQS